MLGLLTVALPAVPALAQNPNQPIYQGAQPQLTKGVEDGPTKAKPKIRHIYLAAPDVLGLTVDAQHLWAGPVQPYVKQPGDEIKRTGPQPYGKRGKEFFWNRQIIRNGVNIGNLVGPKEDHYSPAFKLEGEALNTEWAKSPANYTLSSTDDAAYRVAARPLQVFRKSNPQMWEWTHEGKEVGTARHDIYLKLPRALTAGRRYRLNFVNGSQFITPISFVFNDTQWRTEAIQVNQAGYHPRQREKVARLFQWLGDGGGVDFSGFKNFQLVDDKSGKVAFRSEIKLLAPGNPNRKMAPERTADPDNDLPSPVYQLDFSAFATPGTYRVVVPGLGTSFPFRIDEKVWADATRVAATGFFNQRSGIDLKAPYTRRPMKRTMHPADGFVVHKTDPAIFFDETRFTGGGNAFKRIQASILEDQTEPNAWGGWHDAADYDRSILPQGHMRAVHAMLDVYEANPAYFEKLKLNLPEANNNIPDIVDEALWCTDLFLRIQQPDGGVPSAVESIEHPSEPGWLVGQPTATTPPTPQANWLYAAAAAQMSIVLEKYDAARAKAYRDSAIRAMEWAAKNPQVPNIYGNAAQHENWGAFNMYRLTGEQKWHDEFKRTLKVLYADGDLSKADFGNLSGVASYALLPADKADAALQKQCRDALLKAADAKVRSINNLALGVRSERYKWDERLGQSWDLIPAHRLTGDRKYVDAMDRQAQFALGLNPSNASYMTGIGSREVVPFDFSARYTGGPYPDGLPTQGPGPRNIWRGERTEVKLNRAGIYPAWENWPWAESNFNMREPPMTEHVVGGNMANLLMTWSYLAMAMDKAQP
jgi:endoglucanase